MTTTNQEKTKLKLDINQPIYLTYKDIEGIITEAKKETENINYWNILIFSQLILFLILFLTPVSTYVHSFLGTAFSVVNTAKETTEDTLHFFNPDINKAVKKGDNVAGFVVTSVLGEPRQGGKRKHAGFDFATPTGTQLYIADSPRNEVDVKCFSYKYDAATQTGGVGKTEYGVEYVTSYNKKIRVIHLSKMDCNPGETKSMKGLSVFGLSGGENPHTHIEYYNRDSSGNWVISELPHSVAVMILSGRNTTNSLQENESN